MSWGSRYEAWVLWGIIFWWSHNYWGIVPIFLYTMDSSNKDITFEFNLLWGLVAMLLPNWINPVDRAYFGWSWYQRHGSGWVCHVSGYGSQSRQSGVGGARFIAWCSFLGECQWGTRDFLGMPAVSELQYCVRPTLKKALCHTHLFGGTCNKHVVAISTLVTLYYLFYCNI